MARHAPNDAQQPPGAAAPTLLTDTLNFAVSGTFAESRLDVVPTRRPLAPSANATPRQKVSELGDYRLVAKLGQGNTGAVYRAWQISLGRNVALKVLDRELSARPELVERFLFEARTLARMNHPHLVPCLDVGRLYGFHYLVLEYLDAGSADAWLRKCGRFIPADALRLVLACARALAYGHARGLVHRDVKPDNLLLSRAGAIKIGDLGLARFGDDDPGRTPTGIGAGTPLFIAPEQARNLSEADARSDIYSLGCMLYLFLAGRPPFEGSTAPELIRAKRDEEYCPLAQRMPELPPTLGRMVARCLAASPAARYPDCAAFIADLESLALAGSQLEFLASAGGPRPLPASEELEARIPGPGAF